MEAARPGGFHVERSPGNRTERTLWVDAEEIMTDFPEATSPERPMPHQFLVPQTLSPRVEPPFRFQFGPAKNRSNQGGGNARDVRPVDLLVVPVVTPNTVGWYNPVYHLHLWFLPFDWMRPCGVKLVNH